MKLLHPAAIMAMMNPTHSFRLKARCMLPIIGVLTLNFSGDFGKLAVVNQHSGQSI
jgi:hypothetical protein